MMVDHDVDLFYNVNLNGTDLPIWVQYLFVSLDSMCASGCEIPYALWIWVYLFSLDCPAAVHHKTSTLTLLLKNVKKCCYWHSYLQYYIIETHDLAIKP